MKKSRLKGSITIEAAFALPIFLLGFMAIISLVYIVQTESAVQYGVDQVSREISEYCYIADKMSLTAVTQKTSLSLGDAVENVCGLSGLMDDSDEDSSESESAVSSLSDIILEEKSGESVNGAATEIICRILIPKYISGDRRSADQYLQALSGITLDDINFRYSSILRDGQTINIVAVYKVRLTTFGLLGEGIELTMRNSASTKAWLPESVLKDNTGHGDTDSDKEDENNKSEESKWLLLPCDRGKAWIAQIKSDNKNNAVQSGHGIDLYSSDINEFTEVYSIDVFSGSYSDCKTEGSTDPLDYTIKKNAVKNQINSKADKIKNDMKKIKENLKMENGTESTLMPDNRKLKILMIFPEEAGSNHEMVNVFEEISGKVKDSRGVCVEYMYSEKALFPRTGEEKK